MNRFIVILLLLLSACHIPSFEESNKNSVVIEMKIEPAHNDPYTIWHTIGDMRFPQTIDNWIPDEFFIKTSLDYTDKKGKRKRKINWNQISEETYNTYQIGDTIRYYGEYNSK